jgi:hypothetical protein
VTAAPMNTGPISIVPIFATPLGVVPLGVAEKLNPAIAELFVTRASAAPSVTTAGSNALCYRSGDDLLEWPDEPVRTLNTDILRGISMVMAAVNSFTQEQLQSLTLQARAWFTIVRPDGCVSAATHPMTSWCGIYCVEAPTSSGERVDSGVLRLYESRLGTTFSDATNSAMRLPYTAGHYTWRPVPGRLAVFPASMTHEIALIRGTGRLILVTVRVRYVAPGQKGVPRW